MILNNLKTVFVFIILFFFFTTPAHAIFFWGAKGAGMGRAMVGIADDNHAMEINPAGISQGDHYSIELSYQHVEYIRKDYKYHHPEFINEQEDTVFDTQIESGGFGDFSKYDEEMDEKESIDAWHISIVDSSTTDNFAMGLYFQSLDMSNKLFKEGTGYDVGLSFAYNFIDRFLIGVSGKYSQPIPAASIFNMDVGILIKPTDFVSIGVAGHNLIADDAENYINRDVTVGLAGYVLDYLQLDFDATYDFGSKIHGVDFDLDPNWAFSLGTQAIVLGGFTIRAGFHWSLLEMRNLYAIGLGWTDDKRGSLAYTISGDFGRGENLSHYVSLNMLF